MAPTDKKEKFKGGFRKGQQWNNRPGGNKKRKWVPENKVFDGSVGEGQGFAFRRKQKVQHEYNKLVRKERRKQPEAKVLYREQYPEHLRHLYMAEAEQLRNEARNHRLKRSQTRMGQFTEEKAEEGSVSDAAEGQAGATGPETGATGPETGATGPKTGATGPKTGATGPKTGAAETEQSDKDPGAPETTQPQEPDSLPMSNRMKKKMLRKTSFQKTKEEYQSVIEKRKKKKEEFLKNKQQREEAIQKYKQKKMETFQMLSKKTKKGQPNLNLQMEYLLQKIQGSGK